MKHKPLFFTLLVLVLSACATATLQPASGEQTAPVVESITATPEQGYQAVDIDQAEVEVGVGSPIPVHVIVSGNLPDTCAQIELVQLEQEGAEFNYTISTVPSSAEGCIQDSLPFKLSLLLNPVNLPGGAYTVEANESQATCLEPAHSWVRSGCIERGPPSTSG